MFGVRKPMVKSDLEYFEDLYGLTAINRQKWLKWPLKQEKCS